MGTSLGDAYLYRKIFNHNTNFTFEQTYPKGLSYINLLYLIFFNLINKGPRIVVRKPDRRTGKIYSSIKIRTRSLPCFNEFYELF